MRQWHYASKGQRVGPIDEDMLRTHIQTGTVSLQDLVWTEGMTDWAPVGSVPEFSQVGSQQPGAAAKGEQGSSPQTYPVPASALRTTYVRAHRGATVLTLGILSLALSEMCVPGLILGLIAWSMGKKDLQEIDGGRMDRGGRGVTRAGRICGIAGAWVSVGMLIFWLLYAAFIIAMIRSEGLF